jgi:hypothetical protein
MNNLNEHNQKSKVVDKNSKINAKIKESWSKLSEDDIKLYDSNRAQFLTKLQEKQQVSKADAEKHLAELEKVCSTESGNKKVA